MIYTIQDSSSPEKNEVLNSGCILVDQKDPWGGGGCCKARGQNYDLLVIEHKRALPGPKTRLP